MIKKFCYFALFLVVISIINGAAVSTSNAYIMREKADVNDDDNMREVSFSESTNYPIHSPIQTSPDSEKRKCELYKVLENVFSDEMKVRMSCERIPASSGIMDELIVRFQKFPVAATESELRQVSIDTLLYLESFCSGYQTVPVLFKEKVGHGRSYLSAVDVDFVLSIPMDLNNEKQKLSCSTKQALQRVIKHPFIDSWFGNLVAAHPIKSIGPITKQGLFEGVNAAAEELSCPTVRYSLEEGVWYWQAQIFSVRSRNLEFLRPFLVKTEEPSNYDDADTAAAMTILSALKLTPKVTIPPTIVKPSCCGFWGLFKCGKVCS
ncbi:MAG: hypothetical protein NT128_01835 [Proteobacteria bacterium]|nr:hypothetical protein [Pseudomonadota bacterium]